MMPIYIQDLQVFFKVHCEYIIPVYNTFKKKFLDLGDAHTLFIDVIRNVRGVVRAVPAIASFLRLHLKTSVP